MFAHINFFMITPHQLAFMKRTTFLSCVLLALLFASCQKGLDYELAPDPFNPGGGGGDTTGGGTTTVTGDLLVKIQQEVTRGGSKEVSTTQISWDSNKRLKEYSVSGMSNGQQVTARYRFTRASDGKITRAVEDNYPGYTNIDSIVRRVYYKPGTSQLAYTVSAQYTTVGELGDSSLFTYDANGRVNSKVVYMSAFGMSMEQSKEEYTYDAAGNLTVQKMYAYNGVSFQLSTTMNYSYGTHKAPMQLNEEAFIVALSSVASPNYYTKYTQTVSGNVVLTSEYPQDGEFSTTDRPVKGKAVINGATATFTCTYQ